MRRPAHRHINFKRIYLGLSTARYRDEHIFNKFAFIKNLLTFEEADFLMEN